MTAKRLGRRTAGRVRRAALTAAATAIVAGVVPAPSVPAITLPHAPLITLALTGSPMGAVAIGWSKPVDGGTQITTYGFSLSVNGGANWTAVHSFASKNLVQTTATFPTFVCTNAAPGSQGCLFRIHAANSLGFGAPSKPVPLWTAPGAPRALVADPDADFNTATLTWQAPVVNGGLAVTGYDVLGSMDGAPLQLLTNVTARAATVACTAARTCAYSVRAINSHGTGPASPRATITPAPGPPQRLTLQNTGSDPATGRSILHFTWSQPLTGLPADRYDIEVCGLRVGVPGACDPLSASWGARSVLFPITGAPLATTAGCQSGLLTCLRRVRAVNDRGGEGPWSTLDLRPWAPYGLTVTSGPARGSVTVHFRGPNESGLSGPDAKHYRVIVCDTVCSIAAHWRVASDAVPYPPAGAAPFLAGWFSCQVVRAGTAPQARTCRVRMQFVDGMGNAGPLSAAASGPERP